MIFSKSSLLAFVCCGSVHVPSPKKFQPLSVETIDPGAGYMEEVVQNIRAFGLRGQDYCWYGGTVNQELTEVGAGRGAEGGD